MTEHHRTPSAEDVTRRQTEGVHITQLRPLLVNPEQGAHLTSLSESTFYELLRTGAIRSFKVGRRRVVPVAAIEAWIEQSLRGES